MEKSSYQQRKLALIQEIIDAFEGVARGNGVALHEALGEKIWGWVKSPLPIDCSMEILDLFEEKI